MGSPVPSGSRAGAVPHSAVLASSPDSNFDLIGGSWAVIESDPGVFTTLMQRLGVSRCEAQEIYSVGEDGLSHLGPADLREATSTAVFNTPVTEAEKKRASNSAKKSTTTTKKKRKARSWSAKPKKGKKKAAQASEDDADEFHFVGYVPFGGKVWEIDGLQSAPIEVGDIPAHSSWLDVVRPAIQIKMHRIQQQGEDIRFNLMAIVEGMWEKLSDEIEMLRREKASLERRLNVECEGWKARLEDPILAKEAESLDDPLTFNEPFDPGFGFKKQEKQMAILNLPTGQLEGKWIHVVREAKRVRGLLNEETEMAQRWRSEDIKRSFDYEVFIRGFLSALSEEGLLNPILGYEEVSSISEPEEDDEARRGTRARNKKSRV
ncbi:hypothetical protein FRB96_003025 [Tulasnella sp. 330]|nr:hypothetical protein FRB96_003025 [Tulasnella sp. 330]